MTNVNVVTPRAGTVSLRVNGTKPAKDHTLPTILLPRALSGILAELDRLCRSKSVSSCKHISAQMAAAARNVGFTSYWFRDGERPHDTRDRTAYAVLPRVVGVYVPGRHDDPGYVRPVRRHARGVVSDRTGLLSRVP